MFRNRMDAGIRLAKKLKKFQHEEGLILAVPRGGIVVAYAVAKELGFPMDLILVKKLGHPMNKEYAIGAVSLNEEYIVPHAEASQEYIDEQASSIRASLKKMYPKFLGSGDLRNVKNKTVIVVDDGIATGNTLVLALKMLKEKGPAKIIIATPVASVSAVQKLKMEVKEVISLLVPNVFFGVGDFYEEFEQVTDDEVIYYLERLRKEMNKVG